MSTYKIINSGYIDCRLPSLIFKGEISFFFFLSFFMFGLLSLFLWMIGPLRALLSCGCVLLYIKTRIDIMTSFPFIFLKLTLNEYKILITLTYVSWFPFSLISYFYLVRWVWNDEMVGRGVHLHIYWLRISWLCKSSINISFSNALSIKFLSFMFGSPLFFIFCLLFPSLFFLLFLWFFDEVRWCGFHHNWRLVVACF